MYEFFPSTNPITAALTRKPLPAIDAHRRRIDPCEQRLALSASLAGDLLLEALSIGVDSGPDDQPESLGESPSPDLMEQSAELRASRGLDGQGQTVAVIDSGVAWDHVALGGGYGPGYRVVGGWDFAESDSNPYDDGPAGYHGTHVSGLLAGHSEGFSGVAPGSDIVALRVFDDRGNGQLEWIESALQWVHQNKDSFASPITTVNLSVGAALSDANRDAAMSMLEDELHLLRQEDILVFAASGNLFGSTPASSQGVLYPASSPSVVAVASVNPSGDLSDFAQRESDILAGRGESIASAVPDHVFGWDGNVDDFASLDGTSMAAPQVAAASMLVRQAMMDQGLEPSAEAILSRLRDSAIETVDPLTGASYHQIDLQAAVGEAAEDPTTIDRFDGSNQGEQVELDLRDGIQVRVGGSTYRLDPGTGDSPLVIDVGGGDDSLRILGSHHAERLILRPPAMEDGAEMTSSISTNDYRIELRGFEKVSFQGGGGPDRATMFDSTGADTLTSHPRRATLQGSGYEFEANDVPRIYVHGTAGGRDIAFLHDGEGDDALAVRPQFTSLRSESTFQLAFGFERVYAYAGAGGFDTAQLYDSEGDDTMSVSADRSIIAGPGFQVSARGFASTEGHAIAGGNDIARLYADDISSRWHATDDMVQWTGQEGAVRIARGFERNEAFEQFEPIELFPQAANFSPMPWYIDEAKERAQRDAEAARAVFAALGDS